MRKWPTTGELRAAAWAARARLVTWRQLRGGASASSVVVPRPPRSLPTRATRGVEVALRAFDSTCLVRSLVLQAWHAAHGVELDMIIGVTAPGSGFRAHAWLERPGCPQQNEYREIQRVPAAR